jgi:hypothetical protein
VYTETVAMAATLLPTDVGTLVSVERRRTWVTIAIREQEGLVFTHPAMVTMVLVDALSPDVYLERVTMEWAVLGDVRDRAALLDRRTVAGVLASAPDAWHRGPRARLDAVWAAASAVLASPLALAPAWEAHGQLPQLEVGADGLGRPGTRYRTGRTTDRGVAGTGRVQKITERVVVG